MRNLLLPIFLSGPVGRPCSYPPLVGMYVFFSVGASANSGKRPTYIQGDAIKEEAEDMENEDEAEEENVMETLPVATEILQKKWMRTAWLVWHGLSDFVGILF